MEADRQQASGSKDNMDRIKQEILLILKRSFEQFIEQLILTRRHLRECVLPRVAGIDAHNALDKRLRSIAAAEEQRRILHDQQLQLQPH